MTAPTRTLALLTLLGMSLVSCTSDDSEFSPYGGGGSSSDGADGADGTSGTDTGDTGDDGGTEESDGFEEPGDVVSYTDEGGIATVDLTDISDDPASNTEQEFYLVLVNTGDDELGFQLRYEETRSDDEDAAARSRLPPRVATPPTPRRVSEFRTNLRQAVAEGRLDRVRPATPPPYAESDVGSAVQEFRVRNDLDDETSGTTVRARLWAVGDTVTIWVDEFMPFEVIDDCSAGGDEDEFDNCDLDTIAGIVDANIVPNLNTAFGEASDVNDDGKVSIVITPVLNRLTQGTEDEALQGTLVRSYADPEVDLVDYDITENPLSDEQEVIYVHAPDPFGYFNNEVQVQVDDYTQMQLAAEIARAYTRLIHYNIKVLDDLAGEDEEETWVIEGLGALAADLCGFGAVNHNDVWQYLDAPQLYPLVVDEDAGAITTDSFGAQYLFFRWLTDTQTPGGTGERDDGADDTILEQLLTNNLVGSELISGVTGRAFEELVVEWQVALLTTGVTDADGNPLVDEPREDDESLLAYPPYLDPSFLTAPTENPSTGDFFGANGYQQGINIRGFNYFYEGGTTDDPTAIEANTVLNSGTDHLTLATGIPFFGYTAGPYAAQVVRLTEIVQDQATLVINGNSDNFRGVVIRWTDPGADRDYVIDSTFASADMSGETLPLLPLDGAPIYGLGAIGQVTDIEIADLDDDGGDDGADGTEDSGGTDGTGGTEIEYESGDVYDVDTYVLDLTSYPASETYEVAVELSRHYADGEGNIGPEDPWVALVPTAFMPRAIDETVDSSGCALYEDSFAYPIRTLESLFWQRVLSPQAIGTSTTVSPWDGSEDFDADDFDPCGEVAVGALNSGGVSQLACNEDFDLDGVSNADEPSPDSFLQQVQVKQCESNRNLDGTTTLTAADFVTDEIICRDEVDDDDLPFEDLRRNLGGNVGEDGEEAYLEAVLQGGQSYTIVVGAGTDEGPYEFSVRLLDTGTSGAR